MKPITKRRATRPAPTIISRDIILPSVLLGGLARPPLSFNSVIESYWGRVQRRITLPGYAVLLCCPILLHDNIPQIRRFPNRVSSTIMARMSTNTAVVREKPDQGKEKQARRSSKGRPARKRVSLDKPLVLVGLMGCGKTTIGRRLADRLSLPFMDSDHEIEKAAALSVSEIFEKMGESTFRAGERRVIERLLTEGPKVLATGGGAFMDEDTRALIKDKAISVWLDADINVLVERTARRDTRPLLKNGNPAEILKELSRKRRPIYQEADIHIKSSSGSHDIVVRRLLKAIKSCQKPG